jgi:hypothetical protein
LSESEKFYRELKIRIYDRSINDKLEAYCKNNNYTSLNECIQAIITTFISGVDTPSDVIEVKGGKIVTFSVKLVVRDAVGNSN